MRGALSILSSATALPSSVAPPRQDRRRHRHSSSTTTTKPSRNPNPKSKPQFAASPLTSHSRWDDHRSLRYYTELASKHAEDGRFEDFLTIMETAVAAGVEVSEILALLDGESVANGVMKLIDQVYVDSAINTLSHGARKLGIEPVQLFDKAAMESLRRECSRLLKCENLEQLVSLLETLAGFQFPIKELAKPSDVINLCITRRDPIAAIRFAQNFSYAEMLVCSIILEFGKKKDLGSALRAFEASKQLSTPNMHVLRSIIDVCGLCGDYLKSRVIYEELIARDVIPNTYVLNSLMNVNAHDLNYTLDIYRKMEKLGVTADITSHNIVLKSCCLAAKVELAQSIYKEMQRLESEGELKLDVFTYSTMIKVLADAKMWKLALGIKEDMASSGVSPNTITWSSLISACASAGQVEKAITLFEEMLQAGAQANSQCFNILLQACVEVRQYDRAFRLFHSWKETGFQQTMTQEDAGKDLTSVSSRQYTHIASRVPFRPTTSTYNIMMKACGTDHLRAKALLDEMITFGLSPSQMTWSILINVCGGSGNLAEAINILRLMRQAGIQPDVVAYTTAIKVTYNTILRARSRYGSLQEVQQCLAVYQEMRKAGYRPNDYYLKQLIEEWCEGVIQTENQNEAWLPSHTKDFGPQSLLLEKVAEHLQNSNNESLSIDLRGLTKVEARIVVLAVLRMIKEKHIMGNPIQDDVLIILGQQETSCPLSKDGIGVKESVVRLVEHDLGLQLREISGSPPQTSMKSPTRRPIVPRRLMVTRESLHHWSRRRSGASTITRFYASK
ncbi:pentatricopeptide repeat-containing protein At5g02830, chloroplastic isoform X2 [Andrographis paniculata]|uniref:pentatricopeptide repeat-containing protein At5g02830, chloroplastic isoform X2 n=1 Tax=Andrographis paniculata TaxID=175694 RepID=UPI0021E7E7AF|nr:pentatricopeptide repeat-containing protein At5g02830, chloroplastic isoform X2 [Andrographis paniculata]